MLDAFSQGLKEAAERKAKERKAFNRKLGKPVLFLPDPDATGHGVGWFRADKGFVAYRKYSNGYDPLSRFVLEDELLRALIPHMSKEG